MPNSVRRFLTIRSDRWWLVWLLRRTKLQWFLSFLILLCLVCGVRTGHRGALVQVLSRSAVANAIAQELLRVKVPVRSAFRTAQRDQTVNGMRIPDGTRIVASLQIVRPPAASSLHAAPRKPSEAHDRCK